MRARWAAVVAAVVLAAGVVRADVTHSQAECLLEGKKIVFLGDSITRYCYFGFNAWLTTGSLPDEEYDDRWGRGSNSDDYDCCEGQLWTSDVVLSDSPSHRQWVYKDFSDIGARSDFYFIQGGWYDPPMEDLKDDLEDYDVVVTNYGYWMLVADSERCANDWDSQCEDDFLSQMETHRAKFMDGKTAVWRSTTCCGTESDGRQRDEIEALNAAAADLFDGTDVQIADVYPLWGQDEIDEATFDGTHPTREYCFQMNQLVLDAIARAPTGGGAACGISGGAGPATDAPSYQPTYSPTEPPTNKPVHPPTSRPTFKPTPEPQTTPGPSSKPTRAPTKKPTSSTAPTNCGNDPTWFKKGDPTKDCDWAAQLATRCDAKGDDNRFAYEACLASCGCDTPTLGPSPQPLTSSAPSRQPSTAAPSRQPTTAAPSRQPTTVAPSPQPQQVIESTPAPTPHPPTIDDDSSSTPSPTPQPPTIDDDDGTPSPTPRPPTLDDDGTPSPTPQPPTNDEDPGTPSPTPQPPTVDDDGSAATPAPTVNEVPVSASPTKRRQTAVAASSVVLAFTQDVTASPLWGSVLETAFVRSIDAIPGSVEVTMAQTGAGARRRLLQATTMPTRVDLVASSALFSTELTEAEAEIAFHEQLEDAVTSGELQDEIVAAADESSVSSADFDSVDVAASLALIGNATIVRLGSSSSDGGDDKDDNDDPYGILTPHAFIVVVIFGAGLLVAALAALVYFMGSAHRQLNQEKKEAELQKMQARELWASQLHERLSSRARVCAQEHKDERSEVEIPSRKLRFDGGEWPSDSATFVDEPSTSSSKKTPKGKHRVYKNNRFKDADPNVLSPTYDRTDASQHRSRSRPPQLSGRDRAGAGPSTSLPRRHFGGGQSDVL